MVWSKTKRLRLYRLAISFVTRDIQNGSSFLLFKLEPPDRSHEVNRLLRAQRAEGRRTRWSGWSRSSRASSWSQRLCFGPGSLLRDNRNEAGFLLSSLDRLGATFPRRSGSGRSVHRNHGPAQEVRPRHDAKEFLGRLARR